jgi:YbbR domain-containing protein
MTIKRKIRKSIKPIIGSLLISMTLWFMVTTSKEYTSQIKIPLEITRLAKGKTLLQPIPNHVELDIKGSGQSLIALYLYESSFKLVLPDIRKDTKILLEDYLVFLDLPSRLNLEVVEILDPKTIELKVDDFFVSDIPVLFSGSISTEPGYLVTDTSYSADSVRVSGPKSVIDTIKYIRTEQVEYKNQKYAFGKLLKLLSPLPEIVTLNPTEIEVQFEIQRIVERVVYEIPITIKNVPDNLKVEATPQFLSLRVKGGEKIIEKITIDDIRAEIDFSAQYKPESVEYPVSIKTPPEVSWLESSPKTFKLTVRRK